MRTGVVSTKRNRYGSNLSSKQMNLTFPMHEQDLFEEICEVSDELEIPRSVLVRKATKIFLNNKKDIHQLQQAIYGITL